MRQEAGKTIWVGRLKPGDPDYLPHYNDSMVEFRDDAPSWEEADFLAELCVDDFSRVTGLHLEIGEWFRAEVRIYLESPQEVVHGKAV